jgi:hypothetical protein
MVGEEKKGGINEGVQNAGKGKTSREPSSREGVGLIEGLSRALCIRSL